jgi:hypothetical protein
MDLGSAASRNRLTLRDSRYCAAAIWDAGAEAAMESRACPHLPMRLAARFTKAGQSLDGASIYPFSD